MKYLVTGGAGFIGSHLVDYLLKQEHKVVIIDNLSEKYSYFAEIKRRNLREVDPSGELLRGQFFTSDIRDQQTMGILFQDQRFDGVFHLAAKAGVRQSLQDPLHYFDVNVQGTISLIETCIRHNVPRFVYASSSSVYGNRNSNTPFKESDRPERLMSPYAASKLAAEYLLTTYVDKMEVIRLLRFFNVYGPRQRPDAVLHKFAHQIRDDKPLTQYGDGFSTRDYTYIDDIVKGLVMFMQRNEFPVEIINLGGGNPVPLNKLIDVFLQEVSTDPGCIPITHFPDQPGDVRHTSSDISLAKLYGWEPKVSFEEGVLKFVEWFWRVSSLKG